MGSMKGGEPAEHEAGETMAHEKAESPQFEKVEDRVERRGRPRSMVPREHSEDRNKQRGRY